MRGTSRWSSIPSAQSPVGREPRRDPRGRRSIASASRSDGKSPSCSDGWSALVATVREKTLLACADHCNRDRPPGSSRSRSREATPAAAPTLSEVWRNGRRLVDAEVGEAAESVDVRGAVVGGGLRCLCSRRAGLRCARDAMSSRAGRGSRPRWIRTSARCTAITRSLS